jgi:cobalt-zinc-cadmium efflux system outer membrane protein
VSELMQVYRRLWSVSILLVMLMPAAPLAMTLDQAIESALRDNPGLEASLYDWKAAQTEKPQVTSLPDPTLEFTFGSSGPEYEGDLRTIAVGQALPFPTKILESRSRAESMEFAAGARYEATKRRVVADVKRAYVDLAVTNDKIKILKDDLDDARFMLEAVRQRYELGRTGQHDLVKSQIEVLMVENRLDVVVTDSRAASVERLRALLGLDRTVDLGAVERPFVDFALVDTAAIRAAGVESAPELESIGYMAEAARKDVSLARMQWIPDLKLRFFADQRDMAMGRNKARGIMLSANLPVWEWRTRAAVAEKTASLARKRSELEGARDRLEARLETSLATFAARSASYALFEDGVVPEAELAYLSARTAYETGETDILSLIAARRALRDAKLMQLDLWAGMANELAEIEAITGLEFY